MDKHVERPPAVRRPLSAASTPRSGFYSLDSNLAMRRQVEMALGAGIYGFLFYYYRFGGKRLLEKTDRDVPGDPKIAINFALIWANENWTRRWMAWIASPHCAKLFAKG